MCLILTCTMKRHWKKPAQYLRGRLYFLFFLSCILVGFCAVCCNQGLVSLSRRERGACRHGVSPLQGQEQTLCFRVQVCVPGCEPLMKRGSPRWESSHVTVPRARGFSVHWGHTHPTCGSAASPHLQVSLRPFLPGDLGSLTKAAGMLVTNKGK